MEPTKARRGANQVIPNADDPAPGFYVSTTALADPNRDRKDPRRYVNSEAVNYIVSPGHLNAKVDNQIAKLGDFDVVIRPRIKAPAYSVVTDLGPRNKICKGLFALTTALIFRADL